VAAEGTTLHDGDSITFSIICLDTDSLAKVNPTTLTMLVSTRKEETWTDIETITTFTTHPIKGKYTFTYAVTDVKLTNSPEEVRFRFNWITNDGDVGYNDKIYLYS
jgi:hypothetical protein